MGRSNFQQSQQAKHSGGSEFLSEAPRVYRLEHRKMETVLRNVCRSFKKNLGQLISRAKKSRKGSHVLFGTPLFLANECRHQSNKHNMIFSVTLKLCKHLKTAQFFDNNLQNMGKQTKPQYYCRNEQRMKPVVHGC